MTILKHRQFNKINLIVLMSFFVGLCARLIYLIKYNVQPRDSYKYFQMINEWDRTGAIPSKFYDIPPLGIALMKIPKHFLGVNTHASCLIINMILGFIIVFAIVYLVQTITSNNMILLSAGLIATTNHTLIQFSTQALRENSYLLFVVLWFIIFVKYTYKQKLKYCLLLGVITGISLLCRHEGLELIIFYVLSTLMLKIKHKEISFLKNNIVFLITLGLTVLILSLLLDINIIELYLTCQL